MAVSFIFQEHYAGIIIIIIWHVKPFETVTVMKGYTNIIDLTCLIITIVNNYQFLLNNAFFKIYYHIISIHNHIGPYSIPQ